MDLTTYYTTQTTHTRATPATFSTTNFHDKTFLGTSHKLQPSNPQTL